MLCGSLDGKRVSGRMDMCICMTESLNCPPKTHNIVNQLYSDTKLTVVFFKKQTNKQKKQIMEKLEKEKAFSAEKAVNSGLKETETEGEL